MGRSTQATDDDQTETKTNDDTERKRQRLQAELSSLDQTRAVGSSVGRLGATVTLTGPIDEVPTHLFKIAERYDVDVLNRATGSYGRGVETTLELAGDERREAVIEYAEKHDDEPVEIVFESTEGDA